MKIVMFGHKRIPSREGGVEIVVENLAVRLAAKGHDVTCYNRRGHHVCGSQFDDEFFKNFKNVKLKYVPTIPLKGLAAVSSSIFASIKSAFSFADVVHIHAEGPACACWIPKLLGKKVVVTIHGLDWQREKWKNGFGSKYIKLGEKMAVKYADEIIVLSREVQKYFKETYNRETVHIPNGIERPAYKFANIIKSSNRSKLDKNSYILFLGRLVPEKGAHYLIKAFKDVKTDKKLVIAGGTSDTDEYVQQLFEQAKGDDRIIFTGFVQGEILEELYSNAYIYVLPSDLEGMPLSLLEAMSYGNCCLVSDIAECMEVVEDKAESFMKGNVFDLKNMIQMLCDNKNMVDTYRFYSQDFICEKYNWDVVTDQTEELYKKRS